MAEYENHKGYLRCAQMYRLHYFAHRHREIELVLMREGVCTVVVDGTVQVLSAGDVLIVYPNQLHRYISTGKEDSLLFLIPASIYSDYDDRIVGSRPVCPIVKGAAERKELLELAEMCLPGEDTPYADTRKRCLVSALLSLVIEDLPLVEAQGKNSTLERILCYCEDHYKENLTLDTMSKDLFLGKYYISHLFNEQLGISLTNYLNTLRVEEAVRLLTTTDLSITAVCYAAGFSCTRTFNRAFMKLTGETPCAYLKNMKSSAEKEKK